MTSFMIHWTRRQSVQKQYGKAVGKNYQREQREQDIEWDHKLTKYK